MRFNSISKTAIIGFLAILSFPAQSQVNWDISGNWQIDYYVQEGLYGLSLNNVTEDITTGNFSATGGNGEPINGTTTGSSVQFSDGLVGGYGGVFTGTIAADGTMSGPMSDNNGHGIWGGSFWTISGHASAVPEPSAGILGGIGLLGLVVFRPIRPLITRCTSTFLR